jgi:hypothetical protein
MMTPIGMNLFPSLLKHDLSYRENFGTEALLQSQLLTSSTSFNQRSIPSNDHLFVMSYTNSIPCAPRESDRMIVQNRPCPEVSQSCNFTRFPSNSIIVVLYAVSKT